GRARSPGGGRRWDRPGRNGGSHGPLGPADDRPRRASRPHLRLRALGGHRPANDRRCRPNRPARGVGGRRGIARLRGAPRHRAGLDAALPVVRPALHRAPGGARAGAVSPAPPPRPGLLRGSRHSPRRSDGAAPAEPVAGAGGWAGAPRPDRRDTPRPRLAGRRAAGSPLWGVRGLRRRLRLPRRRSRNRPRAESPPAGRPPGRLPPAGSVGRPGRGAGGSPGADPARPRPPRLGRADAVRVDAFGRGCIAGARPGGAADRRRPPPGDAGVGAAGAGGAAAARLRAEADVPLGGRTGSFAADPPRGRRAAGRSRYRPRRRGRRPPLGAGRGRARPDRPGSAQQRHQARPGGTCRGPPSPGRADHVAHHRRRRGRVRPQHPGRGWGSRAAGNGRAGGQDRRQAGDHRRAGGRDAGRCRGARM
ncbi:MAG: hypothetical protein AVDCRST_MAG59-3354, partial [uncultured Thermomicrobiales bacterium]